MMGRLPQLVVTVISYFVESVIYKMNNVQVSLVVDVIKKCMKYLPHVVK